MRFLVFDDQASAQAAVDLIDDNGRVLFAARGYEIAEDGSLIGKSTADGTSQPDKQHTITWAIPRQRVDGKWVVPHPETAQGAATIINGAVASDIIMQGVSPDSIEDFSSAWFENV